MMVGFQKQNRPRGCHLFRTGCGDSYQQIRKKYLRLDKRPAGRICAIERLQTYRILAELLVQTGRSARRSRFSIC